MKFKIIEPILTTSQLIQILKRVIGDEITERKLQILLNILEIKENNLASYLEEECMKDITSDIAYNHLEKIVLKKPIGEICEILDVSMDSFLLQTENIAPIKLNIEVQIENYRKDNNNESNSDKKTIYNSSLIVTKIVDKKRPVHEKKWHQKKLNVFPF